MSRKCQESVHVHSRSCTGCDTGNDVEDLHPILKVDLCGFCLKGFNDANSVTCATMNMHEDDEQCYWCHGSYGEVIVQCDTCKSEKEKKRVFCEPCIVRNLGRNFYEDIVRAETWSCFVCDSTPLRSLQERCSATLYNVRKVFEMIPSPTECAKDSTLTVTQTLRGEGLPEMESVIAALIPPDRAGERTIASIFSELFSPSPGKTNYAISSLVSPFLSAREVALVKPLSKSLYRLLSIITHTIGVFQTEYGLENGCKLHPHQMQNILAMRRLESSSTGYHQRAMPCTACQFITLPLLLSSLQKNSGR